MTGHSAGKRPFACGVTSRDQSRRSNSNAGKEWIKLDLRATDIIILLTAFFHPKFLRA